MISTVKKIQIGNIIAFDSSNVGLNLTLKTAKVQPPKSLQFCNLHICKTHFFH